MTRRVYIDPPASERCQWTRTLRDGSKAQCGRRHMDGKHCAQHAKMAPAPVEVVVTECGSWTRYCSLRETRRDAQ